MTVVLFQDFVNLLKIQRELQEYIAVHLAKESSVFLKNEMENYENPQALLNC